MQTLKVVRYGRVAEPAVRYSSPALIHNLLGKQIARYDREHFIVLHLNGKKNLLAKETISIGSLSSAVIHPREVFKGAVLNGSAAVILVHNHPAGDPNPSQEDIGVTERLSLAAEILGINILDHVIIGDAGYYSFFEGGKLPMR